jgi:hypothetical protein
MAVGAYILVQTGVGQASDVAANVRALPGVASAEAIAGLYNVIVRAVMDTVDALGRLVVSRVQSIEG